FRDDLFYRLHVFPILVPPLRERPEDIPDLVRHFLARCNAEEGKRIRSVSSAAMALLGAHPWPGNVRQLENAVFRAVVLAEGREVGTAEFPKIAALADRPEGAGSTAAPLLLEAVAEPGAGSAADQRPTLSPGLPAEAGPGMLPVLDAKGEIRPLAEVES